MESYVDVPSNKTKLAWRLEAAQQRPNPLLCQAKKLFL